jgi:hypothetical protein
VKFNSRFMTNLLLAWTLAFPMFHFERELFWNAPIGIALMWMIAKAFKLPGKFTVWRERYKGEKLNNEEFSNVYQPAFEAQRQKYDSKKVWNEPTSVPQEYLNELRTLNRKHRWMLKRRNNMDID